MRGSEGLKEVSKLVAQTITSCSLTSPDLVTIPLEVIDWTSSHNILTFSCVNDSRKPGLSFLEANPSAARDGFTSNHPDQAAALRGISNKTRSEVSAITIAKEYLDQQVDITTVPANSSQKHTIPLRIYRPKACPDGGPTGVVVYFHGGGFLLGDETTDDLLCCCIAALTRTVVISAIYRHTDKHKRSAQVDDAWDAFQYICHHANSLELPIEKNLALMGISAGCTLAASVVLRELEESRKLSNVRPLITGALLSIPWLIHIDNYPMEVFKSPEVSAKFQNAEAPVIPTQRLRLFSDLLGAPVVTDRLLNIPLLPEVELNGWRRTIFQVAGADPLRDDGLLFASRLRSMPVQTRLHIYAGLPHGFRRWTKLKAAEAFDSDTVKSINALMESPGGSQEWEKSWVIYSGKSQEEHKDKS